MPLTWDTAEEANLPAAFLGASPENLPVWVSGWWENRHRFVEQRRGALGVYADSTEERLATWGVAAILKRIVHEDGPVPPQHFDRQLAYFVDINRDAIKDVAPVHMNYIYLGVVGVTTRYGDQWLSQVARARWAAGLITFVTLPVDFPAEDVLEFLGK